MGDAAGELADRFHLLRLAQSLFGLLALGDRLCNASLQRLVEMLQRLLGTLACGDVLKQHRDLATAGRFDTERREFEMTPGGDQLALEAYRYSRPKHAAVEFGPAIGFVGHHLAQLLPNDVGDAGMQRVGRVGLDMDVVAQRAVRAVEEFDDAKAFIDGIEESAVSLFAVGKRRLGAFPLGIVGGRKGAEPCVLRLERRDARAAILRSRLDARTPAGGNRENSGQFRDLGDVAHNQVPTGLKSSCLLARPIPSGHKAHRWAFPVRL